MDARTDKGNMGRWGSDDGKESREALSHVHERCEDDALQSQRIGISQNGQREGRQSDRLQLKSLTDLKKIRRDKANEGFTFDAGFARHNNSDTIPAVPALPAFIYRCVLALSVGFPLG